jgi:hypothetical protein
MTPCLDHATRADRLGTSLEAKRAAAIAYLRSRGKYVFDRDCEFKPTRSTHTDVRRTFVQAQVEIITAECARAAAAAKAPAWQVAA